MSADIATLAKAEFIERIRFQFRLADRLLLALLILNVGAGALRGDHWTFAAGLVAALLAYVGGFLSQHHYALACVHEYARSGRERAEIIRGNCWYFCGLACAVLAIASFAVGFFVV